MLQYVLSWFKKAESSARYIQNFKVTDLDALAADWRVKIQEMERQLVDKEMMLAQSTGHIAMREKIEKQKKTTRDALSYVAELKRERSIFRTPSKASAAQVTSRRH